MVFVRLVIFLFFVTRFPARCTNPYGLFTPMICFIFIYLNIYYFFLRLLFFEPPIMPLLRGVIVVVGREPGIGCVNPVTGLEADVGVVIKGIEVDGVGVVKGIDLDGVGVVKGIEVDGVVVKGIEVDVIELDVIEFWDTGIG